MKLQLVLALSLFLSEASAFVVPHGVVSSTASVRTGDVRVAALPGMEKVRNLFAATEEETSSAVATQDETASSSSTTNADAVLKNQPVKFAQEELSLEEEKPVEEKDNMMQQIKSAGTAGALSLFLWELAFWAISVPVAIFGFFQLNGAWPDFANSDDMAKVGAEAFAFANVARLALPVRIGLAVASIPWVEENIIEAPWAPEFLKKEKSEE